jgi:phosphatidylserine/phosphatidylglycerophosphate/cardiolipin synthase-like enzyme
MRLNINFSISIYILIFFFTFFSIQPIGYMGVLHAYSGSPDAMVQRASSRVDNTNTDRAPDKDAYKAFLNIGQKVKQAFDALDMPAVSARARLITENTEAWYARWHILSQAKKSIDTTYFILANDIFGESMLGMLLKKARQGVKVRLMIDARGSGHFAQRLTGGQDYIQELAAAGCEVKVFNPLHRNLPALPFNLKYLISSNHDKILIVDDNLAITGGRNISRDYFAHLADDPTVFRDTDVLLQGPEAARALKLAFNEEFASLKNFQARKEFLGNWISRREYLYLSAMAMNRWINGRGLYKKTNKKIGLDPQLFNEELSKYPGLTGFASYRPFHGDRQCSLKILDKHSISGKRNDITDSVITLMDACEKEIIIQNPYVLITKRVWKALKRASDRGVKIIIHTNSPVSSDSLLTQAFFMNDWENVLKLMPNCEIWAFTGVRKLHSKVFVFDRKIAAIGTYNMDPMSEQINSEVMACIKSDSFAMRTALRIHEDMRESSQYTLEIKKNGKVVKEMFGPSQLAKGKLKVILNILRKLKFLRPLI